VPVLVLLLVLPLTLQLPTEAAINNATHGKQEEEMAAAGQIKTYVYIVLMASIKGFSSLPSHRHSSNCECAKPNCLQIF